MHFGKLVYELVQFIICLVFVDFYYLMPEIVSCQYGGGCFTLFSSGYNASSLYCPDLVVSPTVVF